MSEKPKVCLIYTGGTLGMVRGDDGVLKPPKNPKDFLRVAPELGEIVDLDFVGLLNKDSTNMIPADWSLMAQAVYDRRDQGYDGFVVAHGTDTMHFSASAVAFALGDGLDFPVVFTGSQATPEVRHGDARVNLLRACIVATQDLAEVVICFGEFVFRACRAQKKDERRFDAFESPAEFPLGYVTEKIILHPDRRKRPTSREGGGISLAPTFADGILQVSLIPGLEPELLLPALHSAGCKGIILQSFGTGNVPSKGEFSFHNFIEEAKEMGKPLIITSQFPASATLHTAYAPGRAAVEAGAIPTGNMTASCAAAKFRWVLAQVDEAIRDEELTPGQQLGMVSEMMQKMFIGEMD